MLTKIFPENEDVSWKVIGDYYKTYGIAYHQLASYERFLKNIKAMLHEKTISIPQDDPRHVYIIKNPIFVKPEITDGNIRSRPIYPNEAKLKDINYNSKILVDIEYYNLDEKQKIVSSKKINSIYFQSIPVMVGSSLCNTYNLSKKDKIKLRECPYDAPGYFIVNGKERILVSQERLNCNCISIYTPEKVVDAKKYKYRAEVRSLSFGKQSCSILKITEDEKISISLPSILVDIPISIVFTVYNLTNDDIMEVINPKKDPRVVEIIKLIQKSHRIIRMNRNDCIEYIAKHTKYSQDERSKKIEGLLFNDIFPHIIKQEKVYYLGYVTYLLILTYLEIIPPTNKDDFANKRMDNSGILLEDLFIATLEKYTSSMIDYLDKHPTNLREFSKKSSITDSIYKCISSGNWGIQKKGYIKTGVSQSAICINKISKLSYLNRCVCSTGKQGRVSKQRQLDVSQKGYICPFETQEGKGAGLVKNLALGTFISTNQCYVPTIKVVLSFESIQQVTKDNLHLTKVFINGDWICNCTDNVLFSEEFKECKRANLISFETTCTYRRLNDDILIYTDGGRLMRMVYTTENIGNKLELRFKKHTGPISFSSFFKEGYIEFIDVEKERECVVYHYAQELKEHVIKDNRDIYLEIHPSLMMGIVASSIPYPETCPAPRVCYSTSMAKQSMGLKSYNCNFIQDTNLCTLLYPEEPIITTKMSTVLDLGKLPAGQHLVCAMCPLEGFEQEDGCMINKCSYELGLFMTFVEKTHSFTEIVKGNLSSIIGSPSEESKISTINYEKLDPFGIIREKNSDGTRVKVQKGDVLFNVVTTVNGETSHKAEYYKCEEEGYVAKVSININSTCRIIKVTLRFTRQMQLGDKIADRSAQKCTVNCILPPEDMPFDPDTGLTPDVLLNPLCLSSRMTMNRQIESMAGMYAVEYPNDKDTIDATAFTKGKDTFEYMGEKLKTKGFLDMGTKILVSGMTGKVFKTKVYSTMGKESKDEKKDDTIIIDENIEEVETPIAIGINYYQRLKHMINDKMGCKDSTGLIQPVNRQPSNQGRKHGLGAISLRLGNMEVDCLVAYGATGQLLERLGECSDKYVINVCKKCKMLASLGDSCVCGGEVVKVKTKYSDKLLLQKLGSIGIKVTIETD